MACRHLVAADVSSASKSITCVQQGILKYTNCTMRGTSGADKVLKYKPLTVPKLKSQSIRLWEGEDYLGLIPGDVVVRDHLRPGYMLWLRDGPPTKNRPAPPAGYDYEVRALDIAEPYEYKHRDVGGLRAREYYLTASQSAAHLRDRLRMAYRFLDGGLRRQARQSEAKFLRRQGKEALNVATIPVEFHLKAPSPPGPVRPGRHGANLSLFTKDRVDLHPAVILRALPKGVFQLLAPVADVEAGDALWLVATDDLEARPYRMPETPWAKKGKAKDMVRIKREQVTELLGAGKVKADGKMSSKARPGRVREEWAREGEERRRKGDQPNRHDRSAGHDRSDRWSERTEGSTERFQSVWTREPRTMTVRARPSDGDQEGPTREGVKGVEQPDPQENGVQQPGGGLGKRLHQGRPAKLARPKGSKSGPSRAHKRTSPGGTRGRDSSSRQPPYSF